MSASASEAGLRESEELPVTDFAEPGVVPPAPAVGAVERRKVRVRAIVWEAPEVLSLELVAVDGAPLPPYTPGAHLDLLLPDGTLRQYSLSGDAADRTRYRLGVR